MFRIIVYLAFIVFCLGRQGQASPYYFAGSCSSLEGGMTSDALQATQKIRDYAKQIQNDPNCNGVGRSLGTAFDRLAKEGLGFLQRDSVTALKLSQMTQEVQALRTFAESDSSLGSDIVRLIINRTQKMAGLSTRMSINGENRENSGDGTSLDDQDNGSSIRNQMAGGQSLMSYSQKVNIAVHTGLNLLNDVIDQLPSNQECLKDPTATGQLLAGIVKSLTVFAGTGQTGMGSSFANTLNKILNVLRDDHFSSAYRELNKQEFLVSLSCLIEATSESYCSVRDNMNILNAEHGDHGIGSVKELTDDELLKFRTGIFEGFYVLTQHIPNITNWIQKVQFGVDPKTPNDADFKDNILDEVNGYFKTLNRVEGELSKEIQVIKDSIDENQKKLRTVKLAITLSRKLSTSSSMGDPSGGASGRKQNFFESNVPGSRMVWFLLGMEDVNPTDKCLTKPSADRPNAPSMPMDCDDWLKMYYNDEPKFNSPMAMIETIRGQYNKLKEIANRTLISYYNRWFIVDRPNLVGEAMTSATYSVPQSLESVDIYLSHLTDRIRSLSSTLYGDCKENCPVSFNDSMNMIPVIENTQRKIRYILAEFLKLHQKVQSDLPSVTDYTEMTAEQRLATFESDLKFEGSYTKVIEEVYESLMVMLARTGFLANRLQTFVYHDISLVLKSNTKFGDYQKYFYFQSGRLILENINNLYKNNMAAAVEDMNLALDTHKRNIEFLETIFKDNLLAFIAESKMISEDKVANWQNTTIDATKRILADSFDTGPEDPTANQENGTAQPQDGLAEKAKSVLGFGFVTGYLKALWNNAELALFHSDRYPTKRLFKKNDSASPDTEFDSRKHIYSRLCLLSLAFNDWRPFHRLCAGVILESPIGKNPSMGNLKMSKEKLNMKYYDQLISKWNNKKLNHSIRICSFRDYLRRNLVAYLIKDIDQEERMQNIQRTEQMTRHQGPAVQADLPPAPGAPITPNASSAAVERGEAPISGPAIAPSSAENVNPPTTPPKPTSSPGTASENEMANPFTEPPVTKSVAPSQEATGDIKSTNEESNSKESQVIIPPQSPATIWTTPLDSSLAPTNVKKKRPENRSWGNKVHST
jgi:hypothetical protein